LDLKVNDLYCQIRKKRTFLTFFRKFCKTKIQKLKFFLQNNVRVVMTRRMKYVTEENMVFLGVFDDYKSQCVYV
jgi:hypothetical protein